MAATMNGVGSGLTVRLLCVFQETSEPDSVDLEAPLQHKVQPNYSITNKQS